VDALRGTATYKTNDKKPDYAVLENEKMLHRKLRFVTDQRLAGVFVWRLEHDNFNATCGGKEKFHFTSHVKEQLVDLHCNEQPWRCRLQGDAHDDDEEEEYDPNEEGEDDVDDSGE